LTWQELRSQWPSLARKQYGSFEKEGEQGNDRHRGGVCTNIDQWGTRKARTEQDHCQVLTKPPEGTLSLPLPQAHASLPCTQSSNCLQLFFGSNTSRLSLYTTPPTPNSLTELQCKSTLLLPVEPEELSATPSHRFSQHQW
jgi:hypothetical protein